MTNADTVRANSDAFSRRDVDAMMEFYAPEVIVTDRRAVGWGEFRGRESVRSYYQGIFDNVTALDEALEIVQDSGAVIVAAGTFRATLVDAPEGTELVLDYALRITLDGGQITEMEIFENAEAAAARPTP